MLGMENYQRLIERISSSSDLDVAEIERRIEAKRAKLSGLVSKEGAAQIVAAELGINFDQERLKISELVHGMKRVNVVGKILEIFPIREYSKNGREGKIGRLRVADDSSNCKVVLWDTNHIGLIENGKLRKDDVIEIANGSVRNGEVHLSSFSDIKHSKEKVEDVVEEVVFAANKLENARPGQNLRARAIIVQAFEPRYFEACPKCGKKAEGGQCNEHGSVDAQKRAILNIVIDDGSETMRCVLFGEQINKLGLNDEAIFSLEKFTQEKMNLLGEEKYFSGIVRSNALYNNTELSINGVDEINPDALIKELESK